MRQRSRHRRLSLTSLIDVIFLLLLFFMLSSTFSRFSEISLSTGTGGADPAATAPIFAQLGPDRLRINGQDTDLTSAADRVAALRPPGGAVATLLLALGDDVTAQRLTDALASLRAVPDLSITVLGGS